MSADTEKFSDLRKKLRQTGQHFSRPTAHKVGEVVAERYEIAEVLGTGPLGTVYKAFDQEVEVDVALKVISPEFLPDEGARQHFMLFMQRTHDLVHDNVVRYFDVDHDDESCFLVTQFLEGLTLRKIMDLRRNKGQRFSIGEVRPIFRQLCQALGDVSKIMIHGGLKPENVVIMPDLLKVTDFGLPEAIPLDAYLSAHRARKGTSHYLAPEVRAKLPYNARADVYSVAVIIVELLTGETYTGDDLSIRENVREVPESLELVLKKALDHDPSKRQADSLMLARALRAALTGEEDGDKKLAGPAPVEPPTEEPEEPEDEPTSRISGKEVGGAAAETTRRRARDEKPRPAVVKETSEVTQQLDVDDIEFDSQVGAAPADDIFGDDAESFLDRPPAGDTSDKTTRMSTEEINAHHDQAQGDDELGPPPPERTQQIQADMIIEGEMEDEEPEQVLLVPPGDLNHSALSGETDTSQVLRTVADDRDDPPLRPLADGLRKRVASKESEDKEARAREALQAFDFDSTLQDAVNAAHKDPVTDSDSSGNIPLPRGDSPLTSEPAQVEEARPPAAEPEQGSPEQNAMEPLLVGPPVDISTSSEPFSTEDISKTQIVSKKKEVNPKSTKPRKMAPVLIMGFILFLLAGTGGAIFYIHHLRSVEAQTELERKKAEALELLASAQKSDEPGKESPGATTPEPAAEPDAAMRDEPVPGELSGADDASVAGEASPRSVPLIEPGEDPASEPAAPLAAAKDPGPEPAKPAVGTAPPGTTPPRKDPPPRRVTPRKDPKPRADRRKSDPAPARKSSKPRSKPATPPRARVAKKPPPVPPARSSSSSKCSRGMRHIPSKRGEGYCIDRYESPGRGRVPRRTSLGGARAGCRARGLRLCTAKEWIRGCGGLFPYGRKYDAARCNTGGTALVPAGSRRGCRSPSGLYDMSGNVAEWVSSGVAMGGSVKSSMGHAGCRARGGGGGFTGFRCCGDLGWD